MPSFIDIAGKYYPAPHPEHGDYAQELFFYTSRYATYTEEFLRECSGDKRFRIDGYRATKLSDRQRLIMAFLLSKPTSKSNTQAIIELVETVAKGRQAIPLRLRRQFRGIQFNPVIHHPEPSAIGAHPLCRVPPADPILNLARRLQIPACLKGKTVFVSFPVLARCLDGANSAIRDNLQQAILLLQRSGYHLHNSHTV